MRRFTAAVYGGTERVVCYLTEELVRQGHVLAVPVAPLRKDCRDCKSTPPVYPFAWPTPISAARLTTRTFCATSPGSARPLASWNPDTGPTQGPTRRPQQQSTKDSE
jgi:hypothetical protein